MSPRTLTPLLFLLLSVLPLFGQVATLTGRITDPSGATVPQAAVTATAVETGIAASTESNNEGFTLFRRCSQAPMS